MWHRSTLRLGGGRCGKLGPGHRSTASNGEQANANAGQSFPPTIEACHLMTREPRLMHGEKGLSGLFQKVLVGSKMAPIQIVGASHSLNPRSTIWMLATAKGRVTGICQCFERGVGEAEAEYRPSLHTGWEEIIGDEPDEPMGLV